MGAGIEQNSFYWFQDMICKEVVYSKNSVKDEYEINGNKSTRNRYIKGESLPGLLP